MKSNSKENLFDPVGISSLVGRNVPLSFLSRKVDGSPFTIRDLMSIVRDSDIPSETWAELLQCQKYKLFVDECFSEKAPSDFYDDFDHIVFGMVLSQSAEDGSWWNLFGVGKSGERYGIDFSPVNQIADFPVVLKVFIEGKAFETTEVKAVPPVTLLGVLYEVFWELSFYGCPSDRDERLAEIKAMVPDVAGEN